MVVRCGFACYMLLINDLLIVVVVGLWVCSCFALVCCVVFYCGLVYRMSFLVYCYLCFEDLLLWWWFGGVCLLVLICGLQVSLEGDYLYLFLLCICLFATLLVIVLWLV